MFFQSITLMSLLTLNKFSILNSLNDDKNERCENKTEATFNLYTVIKMAFYPRHLRHGLL